VVDAGEHGGEYSPWPPCRKGPGSRGLLALAGLELALERLLGSDVDMTTPGGLKPRVREAVLVEARPL
jgi:predicted nucleotidyltransferase